MTSSRFPVIIVGASLAGLTAAYVLGKAGIKTIIIHSQKLPQQKACGEGLSIIGVNYLKQMGLWSSTLEKNGNPFYGYGIYFRDGQYLDLVHPRRPSIHGYGITRAILDSFIYEQVSELSAVTFIEDYVYRIDKVSRDWVIRSRRSGSAITQFPVIACGASATSIFPTASLRNSANTQPRFGVVWRCDGKWREESSRSRVYIHHTGEGQYVITPLSSSSINLSGLLFKEVNGQALVRSKIQEHAFKVAEKVGFNINTISSARGASTVNSAHLTNIFPQIYLVGDALERLDPIGGMGMTHAILGGALAANSITQSLHDPTSAVSSLAHYYKSREKGVRPLRLFTYLSYLLNVRDKNLLHALVKAYPRLGSLGIPILKHRCVKSLNWSQLAPRNSRAANKALSIHLTQLWRRNGMNKLKWFIVSTIFIFFLSRIAIADSDSTNWYLPKLLSDANTNVWFEVDSTWHRVKGVTKSINGKIYLGSSTDPTNIVALIRLPVDNFDTANPRRDKRMREVMHANEHPYVTFAGTGLKNKCTPLRVKHEQRCNDIIQGELTIGTKTLPIEIPILISQGADTTYRVNGELSLKWADYGVEDPSILIAKLDPIVTIYFEIRLSADNILQKGE